MHNTKGNTETSKYYKYRNAILWKWSKKKLWNLSTPEINDHDVSHGVFYLENLAEQWMAETVIPK